MGPYAANHILMLLGRYDFIPPDSIVAGHLGLPPRTPTAVIDRAAKAKYRSWGKYSFLAYRLERVLAPLESERQ